jgi:hypothetical protein
MAKRGNRTCRTAPCVDAADVEGRTRPGLALHTFLLTLAVQRGVTRWWLLLPLAMPDVYAG